MLVKEVFRNRSVLRMEGWNVQPPSPDQLTDISARIPAGQNLQPFWLRGVVQRKWMHAQK